MHVYTSRIAAIVALSAVGCTNAGDCTVTDNMDGTATLVCHDGTSATLRNGVDPTDGAGGEDGARTSLVRVDTENAGENCPSGGFAVHVGEDANRNGVLEDEEISSTRYACNGADGKDGEDGLLVRVEPEAPGERCAAGGYAVLTGHDANGNGILDDAEVTSTSYVCNGVDGRDSVATLVRVRDEGAGESCAHGGKAILVGPDTDGSGTLEDSEVTSTSYVCNGAPGADGQDGSDGENGEDGKDGAPGRNALVSITAEPRGLHCANGGQKIRAGLDANGNGTLEDAEVQSTSYVCHGAEPTLTPGSPSSVMRDGWSVRCLVWSGLVCTRPQVMVMCNTCSAYSLCGVWHDLTDTNDFGESWNAKNFCAVATGNITSTWSSGPYGSAAAPRACNWATPSHPQCSAQRATYVPPVSGTNPLHGLSLEDAYCGAFDSRLLQVECAGW